MVFVCPDIIGTNRELKTVWPVLDSSPESRPLQNATFRSLRLSVQFLCQAQILAL